MADDQVQAPTGYRIIDNSPNPPKGYSLITRPAVGDPNFPDTSPSAMDFVKAFPEAAISFAPMIGAFAGPEGVAAGSLVKQALQTQFPKLFGEGPKDLGDAAMNTGLDLLFQEGIPRGVSALFRYSPGVKQALEADRVATNAKGLEDQFLTNPELDTLPEPKTGAQPPKGRDFATSYNQTLRAGQDEMNKLIYKGYSPTSKALDAPAILDEMIQNPDKYSNIDPIRKNSLREFLTAVSKQKPLAEGSGNILQYEKKRLAFDLTPILLGAAGGHSEAGAAGAGLLLLGDAAIKKLMQNPNIAHMAVKAVQTGFDSPESPLISKLLLYGLRGATVTLQASDGKKTEGTISDDMKFVPNH